MNKENNTLIYVLIAVIFLLAVSGLSGLGRYGMMSNCYPINNTNSLYSIFGIITPALFIIALIFLIIWLTNQVRSRK